MRLSEHPSIDPSPPNRKKPTLTGWLFFACAGPDSLGHLWLSRSAQSIRHFGDFAVAALFPVLRAILPPRRGDLANSSCVPTLLGKIWRAAGVSRP